MRQPSDRLERDELFRLHEQYLTEMRTSLDLAHRNLSFYVGLLSAILVALLAGLLNLHVGDPRGRWLIAGPALVFCLAEVGYSTVRVFYHRFLDAYFTLLNIEHMLKLDQARCKYSAMAW